MPGPVVKAAAAQAGKSDKEMEDLWKKAKEAAKEKYPNVKPDSDRWYSIVMGIFKKMSGYTPASESSNANSIDILNYYLKLKEKI